MKKLRLFAALFVATSAAFFPALLASPAYADDTWVTSAGNVSGNSVQFDYRGGTATYTTTVPDGSTVSVTINNTVANCIGTCTPIADNWTVSINSESFSGNAIEVTTVSASVSGAVTISVYGIDNGFWAGWYGPTFSVSITSPTPTPTPTTTTTPEPTPSDTPTATTSPSPEPSQTPTPTPTPEPTSSPTTSPTPESSPSPTSSPEPSSSPTPSPTTEPSPTPSEPTFPSNSVHATGEEWGEITLTAPEGTVFTSVYFANYGLPINYQANPECSANVAGYVANAFVGKNTGTVSVTNVELNGDPCYGVGKHMSIILIYGPAPTPTPSPTPSTTPSSEPTPEPSPTQTPVVEPSPTPTPSPSPSVIVDPPGPVGPAPLHPDPVPPQPEPAPRPEPPVVVPVVPPQPQPEPVTPPSDANPPSDTPNEPLPDSNTDSSLEETQNQDTEPAYPELPDEIPVEEPHLELPDEIPSNNPESPTDDAESSTDVQDDSSSNEPQDTQPPSESTDTESDQQTTNPTEEPSSDVSDATDNQQQTTEESTQENQSSESSQPPTSPDSLPETTPLLPPASALVPRVQVDIPGVVNGGIQFYGTQSQPQVVGEDGKLTPPAPPPGSGLPIPPDAITTVETFLGQPGGTTFNAPDIAVPVEVTYVCKTIVKDDGTEMHIDLDGNEHQIEQCTFLPAALDAIPGAGEAVQALGAAYVALANIGNDMSPVTRKKAKKILVTTVVLGQIVSLRRKF